MLLCATCNASSPKGTVNILTRQMYLESPEIASIVRDKCGVEISYDEHCSDVECSRIISTSRDFYNYDIIIFPSDMYEIIKGKIKVGYSDLNKVSKKYSADVRSHYLSYGYQDNVAYFALSLSGFVWNPAVIELSEKDSAYLMFKKAKNNTVFLTSNPTAVQNLIDNNQNLPYDSLVGFFNKIIQDADVYIADGYNGSKLYDKDQFAFAFQRSGDAVYVIVNSKNKNLTFLVHPKYSFIVSDMIAELNTRPETLCAARVLASKEVLDIVQKETYCLSPYGTYKLVDEPVFQKVYKPLFDGTHKARWLSHFVKNTKDNNKILAIWNKMSVLQQVVKNNSLILKHK